MGLVRSGMVDLVGEVLVVAHMGAAAVEVALAVPALYLTSDQMIRVHSLLVDPAADKVVHHKDTI